MNDLKIKYLKSEDITPYINNTRTHSEEQISQIKSSIKEFGMCTPIGIHNGTIIYGHARFTALKSLGYEEFPTVDLSYLTDSQKKAYVIADNKLALNAGWDDELLALELKSLQGEDFDLSLIGFDVDELALLLDSEKIDSLDIAEQDYSEKFSLVIDCDDELHQEVTFKKLRSEGYTCQVQSL